jgi:hypothetical protein
MALRRELANQDHVHRFVIVADADGWEVREEEDANVIHRVHRTDWHRVEMDVRLFDVKAIGLKREGWIEHRG